MAEPRFKATMPPAFHWASQAEQYPRTGPAGISYFAGEVGDGFPPVDCLLYRGDEGTLLGILNHYSVDYPPWEKAGNVNLWVYPYAFHRGIGTALLDEAMRRWEIDLDQQRYTHAGAAFVTAYTSRKETMQDV